jgi:hypothetical protein
VIDGDEEWTSPEVIVGNLGSAAAAGRHFDIVAVRADSGAQDRFWNYLRDCARRGDYPGMAGLPSSANVEDRIEVVRQ